MSDNDKKKILTNKEENAQKPVVPLNPVVPQKNVIWINYSTGHVGVETTSDLDKAKKIFDELHDKFMKNIMVTETYMENKRVN